MHAKIIWPRNPSKRASHSYSALCFRLRRWQRLVVTTILLVRQPKLISSDTNATSILFLHVLQAHNDGAMYVIEHSQISWILTLWYFVHAAACFLFAFRVLTLTLVSRSLKNLHSNSTFQRLALPDTKVRDFALVLTCIPSMACANTSKPPVYASSTIRVNVGSGPERASLMLLHA